MDDLKKWHSDPSKGEVFTPHELVSSIIDKIPNEVWVNPKSTFLDPCMGRGTFLIEIVQRLVDIYRYSELDAKSRVYGYDIRVKYFNRLKRRGYVNVQHKDFLSDEIKMKFDVVIGNPPYQEVDENGKSKGGGKGGANNLWSKFILKSFEISDNIFFITPPSFLSPNHLVLNKMYENGGLKLLKIFEESPFQGVGTQACYYYWSKNYNGLCKIDGADVNLRNKILPNSSNPIDFSIFSKFFSHSDKFIFLRDCSIHTQSKKNYITTGITLENINRLHVGSKILYTSLVNKHHNHNKVIISRSGYLNPLYDSGESCTSESNYYCLVNDENEGTNLVKLLKSKLYKYCLDKSKFSGFFHGEVLKNLPKISLENDWLDSDLFNYFELTSEEIECINDYNT
jgi:hypothetical protein